MVTSPEGSHGKTTSRWARRHDRPLGDADECSSTPTCIAADVASDARRGALAPGLREALEGDPAREHRATDDGSRTSTCSRRAASAAIPTEHARDRFRQHAHGTGGAVRRRRHRRASTRTGQRRSRDREPGEGDAASSARPARASHRSVRDAVERLSSSPSHRPRAFSTCPGTASCAPITGRMARADGVKALITFRPRAQKSSAPGRPRGDRACESPKQGFAGADAVPALAVGGAGIAAVLLASVLADSGPGGRRRSGGRRHLPRQGRGGRPRPRRVRPARARGHLGELRASCHRRSWLDCSASRASPSSRAPPIAGWSSIACRASCSRSSASRWCRRSSLDDQSTRREDDDALRELRRVVLHRRPVRRDHRLQTRLALGAVHRLEP